MTAQTARVAQEPPEGACIGAAAGAVQIARAAREERAEMLAPWEAVERSKRVALAPWEERVVVAAPPRRERASVGRHGGRACRRRVG